MNITAFTLGVIVGALVVGVFAGALLRVLVRHHAAERDQLEDDLHALRETHRSPASIFEKYPS